MKHRAFRKTLASLLTALTLVPLLVSCGGSTDSPASDTTAAGTVNTDNAAAETTTAEPTPEDLLNKTVAELPKHDFGGYEFVIADRSDENSNLWYTRDVWTEALNGEPINDAVYERNHTLEDAYNIKVTESRLSKPYETLRTAVLAGDAPYDTVTDGLSRFAALSVENMLLDLNSLDELCLDLDHWDVNLVKGLSVAGKLFSATGDISIMDDLGTWVVAFNKDLVTSLGLDSPYDLVDADKWYTAKMYEMAKAAAADIDGDGQMTDADRYGSTSEAYNVYALWVAGGQKMVTKDKDDLPVLSIYNDRSASVMDEIFRFQTDKSVVTATARRADKKYMYEVFREGNALLSYLGMLSLSYYRDSEVDYGIVTAPKFDEAQESYANTFSNVNCTAYVIPSNVEDASRSAAVLEAMARISKYTLSHSYYDITLSSKHVRDERSVEQIDLIVATRSFDLGLVYSWGGCQSMITGLFNKTDNTFASDYSAKESSIQAAIDKFIEDIK
nr:extracellular solute-binding protein [Clostridia bacterium]